MEPRYDSPEAAARGDIRERFARALGVALSPDGRNAVVLLGTNDASDPYPYQVLCRREGDRWVEGGGANGPGWSSTATDREPSVGVLTDWFEAPPGSRAVIVEFQGREQEVPVGDGYYLFAAWDVPEDAADSLPRLRRFV